MLMYPKVHSASVLENHHFRHGLPLFDSDTILRHAVERTIPSEIALTSQLLQKRRSSRSLQRAGLRRRSIRQKTGQGKSLVHCHMLVGGSR